MDTLPNVNSDIYRVLKESVYQEFSDVIDYIWKSPRLIEHETKIEKEKLLNYFPNDNEHADRRWKSESNKLNGIFPDLIAVGNLFNALSLFESYLLTLSIEIEENSDKKLKDVKGSGINKLFNFLKMAGIDIEQSPLFHQVEAAIKIRNCFSHACGTLSWSKERKELKRIQKSGVFLSKEHRNTNAQKGDKILRIVKSNAGEKLELDNMYSFLLASYLRCFFIDVCDKARYLNEIK